MGTYTPTEAAVWIREVWEPEIGMAAYEEMQLAPLCKRLQPIQGKIHYPKHANLAINTLPEGTAGSTLNFSGQTEVEVTAQPMTTYCAVEVNKNVIARMMNDPEDLFRKSIELALAQGVDIEIAKLFHDLTQMVGAVDQQISEATLLDAIVVLANKAKQRFKPGTTRATLAFHPNQIDDVVASTQNWSQYQMRGDKEGNPIGTGWLKAAYGVDFVETGVIQPAANAFQNGLVLPGVTIGLGWNQETTVKYEEYLLSRRIIGWNDFGALICWDDYGLRYQTTTDA